MTEDPFTAICRPEKIVNLDGKKTVSVNGASSIILLLLTLNYHTSKL